MRPRAALALLALLASALPTSSAGGAFTDPAGDVVVTGAPAPVPPNAATDAVDLLALDVAEEDNDFFLTYTVESLAQPGGSVSSYWTDFAWMDASFRVLVTRSRIDPSAEPLLRASLHAVADGQGSEVTPLDVGSDGSTTLTVRLPKVNVVSLQGHAPVYGSELLGVVTRASMPLGFGPGASRAEDVMPDSGAGTIAYEKGGSANGHLVLEAPDPVRVSNGGATTFVFQGHLQNRGEADDAATLAIEDLPESWQATTVPFQQVPAQEERPVFVVVTIPFAHEHGGFSNFTLTATSTSRPDVEASLRYGVLHTPVPMPAAHHSDLFLHARPADSGVLGGTFAGTTNTMSTLGERAADEVEHASPDFRFGPGDGPLRWTVPLGPALAMGLDADLNRSGEITGSLLGRASGDATLEAELVLARGETDVATLATGAPTPIALDLQSATPFAIPLAPTPAFDYVPYSPGQNLVLRLTLTPAQPLPCCGPTEGSSALVAADFRMFLPLNEYADQPQWDPGVESTVALEAVGPLEREGRPGTTLAYELTLTNRLATEDEIDLGVAGTHASLATLAPAQTVRLAGGASRTMTLAVAIPALSADGERLEVLLVARSASDPSNIAIARTLTFVESAASAQDERSKLEDALDEGKDAPLPLALVLAALAGGALVRKR